MKYEIIDSVFIDSLGGVKVPKGTISIQDPIPGTFVKEGRTLYFTVRRISSEKIRIPEEVFDGKDKTYMKNNFGSNFKLNFTPKDGSDQLVVKSLRSGGRSLIGGDMLIKGSLINVYLEEDIDKDNTVCSLFDTKIRVLHDRFLAFPWGPGGFRKLREACRNHFHLSWYL